MWLPSWAASAGGRALLDRLGRVAASPFRWYHRQLAVQPLLVKSITSGTVLSCADLVSQWLCRPTRDVTGAAAESHGSGESTLVKPALQSHDVNGHHWWNVKQTLGMGLYGSFFVAPFCHLWYHTLEHLVPIHGVKSVTTKLGRVAQRVMLDQVVVSPVFATGLFLSRGFIAGEDMATIWSKMKTDFPKVILAGATVWPSAQMINFFFVPLPYRVLFINMVGFGWSTYTSIVASRAFHHDNTEGPRPRIHQPITLPPYLPRYIWVHSHPHASKDKNVSLKFPERR